MTDKVDSDYRLWTLLAVYKSCHCNNVIIISIKFITLIIMVFISNLIDSAPARSLLFFVVDSVCMSVCMSVTLLQIDSSSLFLNGIEPFLGHQFSMTKLQNIVLRILICSHGNEIWAIFTKISNCFFFVFRWNRAIFWPLVLRDPLYKTFVLRFLI